LLIRLQQRRGTDTQWSSSDPVLAAGEIALSTDDQTFRMGDGVTAWSLLPYFQNAADIEVIRLAVLANANSYSDTELDAAILSTKSTLSQAISDSETASNTYTDTEIASLIDSAPETLNTLKEIAEAIAENDGDIGTILAALDTKAATDHTHTLSDLTNVDPSGANLNDVLFFDNSDQTWKPKELIGIDAITVATVVPTGAGELSYNSNTGAFSFAPAITGVTAGSFGVLNSTTTFAASTGSVYTYWDGAKKLEVSITTTSSYVNLISLTSDHFGSSSVKLVRVVDSVETDLFTWPILGTRDFGWTYYDQHNLDVGTVVTYRIKGQSSSGTSYIGKNADVQMHVQEVAGALGGQPTSPYISVAVEGTGSTTGGLAYDDGLLTYTPVLPAAAALSELTDVDLTGLSDTDVLAYDLASGTWLPGSAASSVAQLSDVDLTGMIDKSLLQYSSSSYKWEATSIDIAPSLVAFNPRYGPYTFEITDKDKMVECTSEVTFTVPNNSSVAFPIGSTITVMQKGSGQITIVGASGVSLNFTPSNKTRTQYSSATLIKRDTNVWYLMGDLE
jgi:hypothetical protein